MQNQQSRPPLLLLLRNAVSSQEISSRNQARRKTETKCLDCFLPIPQETLQEETSEVRRPRSGPLSQPQNQASARVPKFPLKPPPWALCAGGLTGDAVAPAPLWGTVTPVAAPSQEEVLRSGGRTPPLPACVSLTLWGLVSL